MDNLIWSGGYDSTALLLSKFGEENRRYNVISFYCDATSNCDEDRQGRERVKNILSSHKNYVNFTFNEIEIKGHPGGMQGTVWPGLTLDGIKLDTSEESRIHFGYIRGDDFWHYRSHIESIYESISKILISKVIPVFPFEWKYKKDLIYLYSTIPSVFDSISWAGDTASVKLKEKDELQTMLEQINLSLKFSNPTCDISCKKETLTKSEFQLDFCVGKS